MNVKNTTTRWLVLVLLTIVSVLGCVSAPNPHAKCERLAVHTTEDIVLEGVRRYLLGFGDDPDAMDIIIDERGEPHWRILVGPEAYRATLLVDPTNGEVVRCFPHQ